MKKTILHVVFIFAAVIVFAQTGRLEVIMANNTRVAILVELPSTLNIKVLFK